VFFPEDEDTLLLKRIDNALISNSLRSAFGAKTIGLNPSSFERQFRLISFFNLKALDKDHRNQYILINLNILTNRVFAKIIIGERKMSKDKPKTACCETSDNAMSCCKIESLISVDERGQMVLPKELRDKANIKPGDKLALVTWEKDGEICCLTLIKADNLAERVREFLGPVMRGVF
jgi:antitoxin PrlF